MERPHKPLTPNLALTESDVSFWWVLKEARRLEASAPRRGSDTVAGLFRRLTEERRKSVDGWISSAKEQLAPSRQLSLRRHRWNLSEGRHLFLFSDSYNDQEDSFLLYFSVSESANPENVSWKLTYELFGFGQILVFWLTSSPSQWGTKFAVV